MSVAANAPAAPNAVKYQMIVPHHKTTHLGKKLPPIPIKSCKLTALLDVWLLMGRPQVCGVLPTRKPQCMFSWIQ
jgi:hypothetical protein